MYYRGRMEAVERRRIPLHSRILIGLVAGAAVGGTVNALLGSDSPQLKFVIDQISDPIGQQHRTLR